MFQRAVGIGEAAIGRLAVSWFLIAWLVVWPFYNLAHHRRRA